MASCKRSGSGKSVCHGKDEEFTEAFYKIYCVNNKGHVQGGHYLKFEDNQVTADASPHDEKTRLKIRSVQSESDELIMIIENENKEALLVDRDNTNDKFKLSVRMNEELDNIHKLRDAEQFTNNYLFKKIPLKPGSEIFQITSNVDGKPLTVAFDEYGKPMDPSQGHGKEGSLFRLQSLPA